MLRFIILRFDFLILLWLGSCLIPSSMRGQEQDAYDNWKSISVTASAYNSLDQQGVGNPTITAWGDTLNVEVQSVAVSRDLLDRGIDYGTPIKIKGLDGIFIVNDKMHWRWENKIDIYMGTDRDKALQWGVRTVEICFPNQQNKTN